MKRLIPENENTKNTAQEYDRIFFLRKKKGLDWADKRRWKALLKYYNGGELIDLGCLDSGIVEIMKDNLKYTGVDLAQKAMKSMQKKYPKALFVTKDLYNLGEVSRFFDYAVLGEVLEHLEHPHDAVKEAFRILTPGGVLAISVPLEEEKEPGACDGERHVWSYNKQDILDMVEPYSSKIRTKVLRSQWFPCYRYSWPTILIWAKKI